MNPKSEDELLIQTVRGMHDILPEKSPDYVKIETGAREIFALYGYKEIRTPVLEFVSLFERALGASTDIVEKEMFTLQDRGERLLCLRPEGTAGVVRAYIENSLGKKSNITKLFYMGPMFRAERPQSGRYREFVQVGSEYFGNESPAADAETILLASEILKSAGVPSFEIHLNSIGCEECRPLYQKLLVQFLEGKAGELCQNCRNRMKTNPLRVMDCKEDAERLKTAPLTTQTLCTDCADHHSMLQKLLEASGEKFISVPTLVRGLDYYTGTVFEIYPSGKLGSQDALAAGGRYDTLVRDLGGEKIPAVGFALGVERLLNLLQKSDAAAKNCNAVFVASLGTEAFQKSFQILNDLRKQGIHAEGTLNNQSLKSQMRMADSLGMRFCLIIGENELKENAVTLRDLKNQSQKKVPMSGIAGVIKSEA